MKKYRLLQWYPSLLEGVEEGVEVSKKENRHSFYTLTLPNATYYFTEREVEDNNFWEEVKYNILSFFDKSTSIASVERVSDGEIFSVKDTLSHGGRIKEIVKDENFSGGIKLIHDFGATAIRGASKIKRDEVDVLAEKLGVSWVRKNMGWLPVYEPKDQKIFSYNDIVKLYNDSNNNFEKINHSFARVLRAMEKQLSDEI